MLYDKLATPLISQEIFTYIKECYSQTGRYYHTLQHIEECLEHSLAIQHNISNPTAMLLAVLFHDIIYNPQADNNEERSAIEAKTLLKNGYSEKELAKIESLILVTKHPSPITNQDEAYMVDIDCAIFGSSESRYREYCKQVRMEYHQFSDSDFLKGRKAFLTTMLSQENLYHTTYFQSHYTKIALKNISSEMNSLNNYLT